MPQIRLHGIKTEDVGRLAEPLVTELTALVNCPRHYFVLECCSGEQFVGGGESSSAPFVEVLWFDRDLETQDAVAAAITDRLRNSGYANVDVVFIILEPRRYYENSQHF